MPERAAGGEDPAGDLAPVGDEQPGDRRRHGYIRKTPKRRDALDRPRPSIADRHDAEDGAGVARVDDAVVVELAAGDERVTTRASICSSTAFVPAAPRLLVDLVPAALGRRPRDDRQHAGELLRPHHRGLGARPGEQEPRVEAAPAHAVVAGAVGGAHHERQVRDGGVGDRVDHHRAVLDDPALLVLLADHVAGGVLQEQQRRVGLVGELDELGGLLRLLAEQHARALARIADRVAVQLAPSR